MRRGSGSAVRLLSTLAPVLLFLVFSLCALSMILFAASVCRRAAENTVTDAPCRTAASYITEKLRAGDTGDAVSVGELNGHSALLIREEISGSAYVTAIYTADGALRELFMIEGASLDAGAGTEILKLSEVSFIRAADDLIVITCTDDNDRALSTKVALRSH